MSEHACRPSPDPRTPGRCACGRQIEAPTTEPRDTYLERSLTEIAARSRGFTKILPPTPEHPMGQVVGDTGGLDEFADARALPGGVRLELDPDRETAEELADARNYLVWGIARVWDAFLAGDSAAAAIYDRRMRALALIVAAWRELHTEPS